MYIKSCSLCNLTKKPLRMPYRYTEFTSIWWKGAKNTGMGNICSYFHISSQLNIYNWIETGNQQYIYIYTYIYCQQTGAINIATKEEQTQ